MNARLYTRYKPLRSSRLSLRLVATLVGLGLAMAWWLSWDTSGSSGSLRSGGSMAAHTSR